MYIIYMYIYVYIYIYIYIYNIDRYLGFVHTDLHIKGTDCHQYLEYTSSHPEHTKKSIIYSQTARLSRLLSFEQEFKGHKKNLISWFVKRRCENVNITDSFTSSVTQNTYKINHKLNCDDK